MHLACNVVRRFNFHKSIFPQFSLNFPCEFLCIISRHFAIALIRSSFSPSNSSKMGSIHTFRVNYFLILTLLHLGIVHFDRCDSIMNEHFLYPDAMNSRVKTYTFVITEGIVQPDNYKQVGYLINGQFPGPTIYVNQHDLLQVHVINLMSEPTTIHFHGLLQAQSLGSDGVPHVTQHPIMPNETYTYEILIGTQTGTFMYHGHVDFDIVFIHGALIIRDNPSFWHGLGIDYHFEMGYEYTFLLEEMYHYSLKQFVEDVTGVWKGKPPVMSLPINGYSYGMWPEDNGDAPGYEVVSVIPGKTYRFRVINIASDNMLRFRIDGHRFRVIEMDGILTFPVWTDHLEINSGQRYSVMVTMDRPADNFWIHSEIINGFRGGPSNGKAILSYIGAPDPTKMRKMVFDEAADVLTASTWILPQLVPNKLLPQTEVYEVPKKSNKRIFIDAHMKKVDGQYKFLINGHHFEKPELPYIHQVRNGIDIGKNNKQVYSIMEGQVVDIVFQNRVMDDGPCIQHPWHLHGHSFWIVAEGPDTYDTRRLDSEIDRNILRGQLQFRDVFTMFPYQKNENTSDGAGCGWAVIRFLANNPGIWISHCHITTHALIGKKFVIYERSSSNAKLVNE